MFGNPFLVSLADKFADEILADAHRLNSEQSGQFFEWLEGHFDENNFDFADSPREEHLRIWLNSQTPMLLLIENEMILKQVNYFGRENETKN